MANDFLPQLRNMHPLARSTGKRPDVSDFLFVLVPTDNGMTLRTTDKKMRPTEPDYRYYSGEKAQLLRSIDKIRQDRAFEISWDEDYGNDIPLDNYPHLIYMLTKCDNIVNDKGKPIGVNPEMTEIRLLLHENKGKIRPRMTIDGEGKFAMLNDSYALTLGEEPTIRCVASVGDNYSQLNYFSQPFASDMIEQYLSVLFSYVENVKVDYEGYNIEMSETPAVPAPALSFEKINADKTLFLRVVEKVKGLPVDFVQQFDVSMIASMGIDKTIRVKRLTRIPIDEYAAALRKEIIKYAPDRQSQKEVYLDDNLFIIPENIAGAFLLHALPSLLREYELIGAEKLREYKVKAMAPSLNVKLSSGIDFLEGDAEVTIGEDTFTLQQLFAQYSQKKYVELTDGNRAILDDSYMRRLERIFKQKKGKDGKIKVSFFDLPEIEELINAPLEGETFRHHREVYEGFNKLREQKLKAKNLNAQLRPYQEEGIKWIKYLYDNNLCGCLADDMGLGKTVQTIGMLTMIYPKEKQPTLIVMPRSLLFNWQNELQKFAPKLKYYVYYGNDRDIKEAMKHQVILTTYAIVRNDIEAYSKQYFHYVILDESQNIKNTTTLTTQAAFVLKADHRLALSGTPVENNLSELYSLFRFLNPTMFGTLDDFNRRYAIPIQKDDDKDTLAALRKKIFPFMLRRLKKDVLNDLPDRIEQTLYVEMNQEQHDFYEQRRLYYLQQVRQTIAAEGINKSQFVMFQALNELRRIASIPESLSDGHIKSPKLDLLSETLLDAVANGHKTVVFFNFIAGIEQMSERLDAEGIDYACMTGSTRDRKSVVERFQNDPHCMVMLMTLKTGGVGLNLTAADTVFIFEPWWNKAAEEQAINRLHRFGQKAKVLSYSIITQQTIEEKIQLLQQKKAELFEGLIGTDSSSSKQLSEEDINFILG
ncbi:MAG: DEAD/DEAH box helicase [Prevotella sp.]